MSYMNSTSFSVNVLFCFKIQSEKKKKNNQESDPTLHLLFYLLSLQPMAFPQSFLVCHDLDT